MESNNVRVVNLSGYQTPVVKEVYNKDWVEYGENNDYFKKLIDNYLGSPTNSRCINGIVDMISGRGLEATTHPITTRCALNVFCHLLAALRVP